MKEEKCGVEDFVVSPSRFPSHLLSQLLSFPHLAVSRTLRDLAIMANKLKAMAAAAAAAAVAPTGAFVLFFSPQCFLWDCASPTFNL